jgi:hypothetical protein
VFIHANHIRPVHDARIRRECATSELQEERLIANEDQLVVRVLFRPANTAWDYLCGTVVAAHCIECKADAA